MSIGVIGGADGPTTILVASSPVSLIFFAAVILGLAAVIGIAAVSIVKRKRRNR